MGRSKYAIPEPKELYEEYKEIKEELYKQGKSYGAIIELARKYNCPTDVITYNIKKVEDNEFYKKTEKWAAEWEETTYNLTMPVIKQKKEPHETVIIPAADIPRGFLY